MGAEEEEMSLINMTPHAVLVFGSEVPDVVGPEHTPVLTIPACGNQVRLQQVEAQVGLLEEGGHMVPEIRVQFGAAQGLPEPMPGVLYIVSSLVLQALPDRDDLRVPARLVRDAQGRVVGCRALGVR